MEKSADAFRTISEVATELDVPQHVLRFWESKFPQIKPLKRAGGRRYYRPQDIDLLRAIKQLLYAEGFTIKGVQRILKERGARAICSNARQPPWIVAPAVDPEPDATTPPQTPDEAQAPDPAAEASDPSPEAEAAARTDAAVAASDAGPESEDAAPFASLAAADVDRLRAILAELERCADILAAARQD